MFMLLEINAFKKNSINSMLRFKRFNKFTAKFDSQK